MLTLCRPTATPAHYPPDRPPPYLPRRDPTFAHVRRQRLDIGHHVGHCRLVFLGIGGIDIGCRRRVWPFRWVDVVPETDWVADMIVENHHPLPRYTQEILNESLDVSPPFMRYYRDRLVSRVGDDDESVVELDRRGRKGWGDEWMPTF